MFKKLFISTFSIIFLLTFFSNQVLADVQVNYSDNQINAYNDLTLTIPINDNLLKGNTEINVKFPDSFNIKESGDTEISVTNKQGEQLPLKIRGKITNNQINFSNIDVSSFQLGENPKIIITIPHTKNPNSEGEYHINVNYKDKTTGLDSLNESVRFSVVDSTKKKDKEVSINSIALSSFEDKIMLGGKQKVQVFATKSNGTTEDVTDKASLSIDDNSVAKINDNGEIEAVSEGNATVTVKMGDLEKKYSIHVMAEDSTNASNSNGSNGQDTIESPGVPETGDGSLAQQDNALLPTLFLLALFSLAGMFVYRKKA